MSFYLHQFTYQLGFWFTWLLIPIVVEIFPAIYFNLVLIKTSKKASSDARTIEITNGIYCITYI